MFADEPGKNRLRKPNIINNGDLSKTYERCIGWSCNGTGFASQFLGRTKLKGRKFITRLEEKHV
jgi:hypothetical protein